MKNKGFSLIELLVVVALIGILTVVGVVVYNGFIDKAEEATCKKQHNDIKEIIQLRFVEARLESGPGIRKTGGLCFQGFLPTNLQVTDISQVMGTADERSTLCDHTPESSHTYYADHIYALGFRNCSNFGDHPYTGTTCYGKQCPAMATYGRLGSAEIQTYFSGGADPHIIGQTIFACGAVANLSDPNKCYLGTKVNDDKVIEEFITK